VIDRLVRLVACLLVCFVVIGLGLRFLLDGLSHTQAAGGAASRGMDPVVAALITVAFVLFLLGVGVRAVRSLTGRGRRGNRDRDAQEHQVRTAVRRLATDVPVIPPNVGPPSYPDPALDLGGDE